MDPDPILKTGSGSIEAVLRKRRILFAGLVIHIIKGKGSMVARRTNGTKLYVTHYSKYC